MKKIILLLFFTCSTLIANCQIVDIYADKYEHFFKDSIYVFLELDYISEVNQKAIISKINNQLETYLAPINPNYRIVSTSEKEGIEIRKSKEMRNKKIKPIFLEIGNYAFRNYWQGSIKKSDSIISDENGFIISIPKFTPNIKGWQVARINSIKFSDISYANKFQGTFATEFCFRKLNGVLTYLAEQKPDKKVKLNFFEIQNKKPTLSLKKQTIILINEDFIHKEKHKQTIIEQSPFQVEFASPNKIINVMKQGDERYSVLLMYSTAQGTFVSFLNPKTYDSQSTDIQTSVSTNYMAHFYVLPNTLYRFWKKAGLISK